MKNSYNLTKHKNGCGMVFGGDVFKQIAPDFDKISWKAVAIGQNITEYK